MLRQRASERLPASSSERSTREGRPRCEMASFSRGRHLGERAPVAVVGHEHAVVAEPARAALLAGDQAGARAFGEQLAAVGPHDHRDRAEAGAAGRVGSPSTASSFVQFSSSVAPSPANEAVSTPGAPSSASTSRPESSATAGASAARATAAALSRALPTSEPASSTTSPTPSGRGSSSMRDPRMLRISAILPALVVAQTSRDSGAGRHARSPRRARRRPSPPAGR